MKTPSLMQNQSNPSKPTQSTRLASTHGTNRRIGKGFQACHAGICHNPGKVQRFLHKEIKLADFAANRFKSDFDEEMPTVVVARATSCLNPDSLFKKNH